MMGRATWGASPITPDQIESDAGGWIVSMRHLTRVSSAGGHDGSNHLVKLQICPDSTLICQPLGALDLDAATRLRHLITAILRPGLDLVFDLSEVDRIDAVGASALVGSIRRVAAVEGRCRVRHANPRIRWILDIIGVDRLVTRTRTPDEPDAA